MFRGRHDHAIDPKGRLSIPAAFRSEISRRSDRPPILTTDKGCLALYPFEQWERFEASLEAADPFEPSVQKLTRFYIGNSVECPVDGQGRILIPKNLRDHAGLKREASLTGLGTRIEIWDTAALDQELKLTYENLDNMRAEVAGRGR